MTTTIAPAPWALTGGGYILLLRGVGAVMAVRYTSSGVGPYDELLCIPAARPPFTVSHIYVSTRASVDSGRANWGLPKRQADFLVSRKGNADVMRVFDADGPIAELRMRAAGPSVTFDAASIPAPLRTLAQELDGRRFVTRPVGRGRIRPARLLAAWANPARFPDIGQGRQIVAVGVDDFSLTFPAAKVTDSL